MFRLVAAIAVLASVSQSFQLRLGRFQHRSLENDQSQQNLRRIAAGSIMLRMNKGLEVPDVPRHIDFATDEASATAIIPTSSTVNTDEKDHNIPISTPKLTPVEQFFRNILATASQTSQNAKDDSLQRLKELGSETMKSVKLPYAKAEAWRFTNIRRFFDPTLLPEIPSHTETTIPELTSDEVKKIRSYLSHYIDPACRQSHVVILNGRVEPSLSDLTDIPEKIDVISYLKGHLSGSQSAQTASLSSKKQKALFEKLFEHIPDIDVHPFKSYGSDSLTALNLIKMEDYLYLHVPKSCKEKVPIQILSVNFARPSVSSSDPDHRDRLSFPRIAIYVGNSSTLNLKQSLVSLPDDLLENDAYLWMDSNDIYQLAITKKDNRLSDNRNNLKNIGTRLPTCNTAIKEDDIRYSFVGGFTRIYTESKAKVQHIFLQEYAQNVRGYDVMSIDCGNDTRYDFHPVQMGSDSHRLNYHQHLREPGANTTFGGATLADTAQALNIHSSITHNNTLTACDQNQRMLLGEKAYAVFRGILIMPTIAKNADGSQIIKAFMLGNESRVHCMPFLDLKCGDIKCAHGAAVGDLSYDDLFYLSSRGLGPEIARPLLTKSFVYEAIQPTLDDPLFAKRLAFKMTRLSSDVEDNSKRLESADVIMNSKQLKELFDAKRKEKAEKVVQRSRK